MVMASAVDNAMAETELVRIGQLIDILPVFDDFEKEDLLDVSQRCAKILAGPEGLEIALETIRDALPEALHETPMRWPSKSSPSTSRSSGKNCVSWNCCVTVPARQAHLCRARAQRIGPIPAHLGSSRPEPQ